MMPIKYQVTRSRTKKADKNMKNDQVELKN